MARGRKKALTLDEQLKEVISELEATEEKLKGLKKQKEELEGQIKMKQLEELNDFISSRGLSIDEVKEILEKK